MIYHVHKEGIFRHEGGGEIVMSEISDQAEPILQRLGLRAADDWLTLGRVLVDLERVSRASEDGNSWQTEVSKRLKSLGHEMSAGHLYKVRRVYDFLEEGVRKLGLDTNCMAGAKLSSLEVAERLYRLDPVAGEAALAACLRPSDPAGLAEIKAMYDRHVAAHPERMTPRQLGWMARRTSKQAPPDMTAPESANSSKGLADQEIRSILARTERDLLAMIRVMEATLAEREARIQTLEEELESTALELQEALQNHENERLSNRMSYEEALAAHHRDR